MPQPEYSRLLHSKIPIFSPKPDVANKKASHPFTVSKIDRDSGIRLALQDEINTGASYLAAGHHIMIELDNPSPHHPDGNTVLWIGALNKDNQVVPVHNDPLPELLKDKEFLDEAEKRIQLYLAANPHNVISMHIGYTDPPDPVNPVEYAYPQSIQSIMRNHVHKIGSFKGLQASRYLEPLNPNKPNDLAQIPIFFNISGELGTRHFDAQVRDFSSHPVTFSQHIDSDDGGFDYPRTLYGFESLHQALTQVNALRTSILPEWDKYIRGLYNEDPSLFPDGLYPFKVLQSLTVNCAITILSEEKKKLLGIDNKKISVYAAPFAICSAVPILEGVLTARNGAKSKV